VLAKVLRDELDNFLWSPICKWWQFLNLMFNLFYCLILGRIDAYSIGLQKGELEALLCKPHETKCKCMHFLVKIGAIFEEGAELAILSDLPFLLYTIRVEDHKPLQHLEI